MATDENITYVLEASAAREAPRMPSSQFRVAYVGIDQLTAVTVMGRVIAYYLPVGPAPRSAQQPAPSLPGEGPRASSDVDAAGRSEAPGLAVDASPSPPARRASASGRRASQPRTPKPSAATPISDVVPTAVVPRLTQADRDKVLRRVNRTGSER